MKLATKLLLALGLVAIFSTTSQAQIPGFESAMWDTLTTDSLRDALSSQPIEVTPNELHLTYAKSREPLAGWTIYYRYLNLDTGWSMDRVIPSDTLSFEPAIAGVGNGHTEVALVFGSQGDIYGAVVRDSTQTFQPENLTSTTTEDLFPTVAMDMLRNIHAAWITTTVDGDYKIAYGTGTIESFDREVITASELGPFGTGASPYIVLVDDLPHIFYRGVNDGYYQIHHAYRETTGGPWQIEFLSTGNNDDFRVSAVVDDSSMIHLAISGNGGFGMHSRVYHMHRNPNTGIWEAPMLVTGDNSATDGNIAVASSGIVYVASAGLENNFYNGNIYVSYLTPGNDSFQTMTLANYPDANKPAIDFINDNIGVLVFQASIDGPSVSNFEIIFYGTTQVGVEDDIKLPEAVQVAYNYPNPFNAQTLITVRGVSETAPVLNIYDITGRKVSSILPQESANGDHKYLWNGVNESGAICPSGTYFYKVDGQTRTLSGKMTLLK